MSRKAIFVTFASTAVVVFLIVLLSWWMWVNQPTADIPSPPVPEVPNQATASTPPLPSEPRLMGDIIDDGIVDSLDVNGVVVQWKQTNIDYNLVDDTQGTTNLIDSLDLIQVFKNWQCTEQRADKNCPYRTK